MKRIKLQTQKLLWMINVKKSRKGGTCHYGHYYFGVPLSLLSLLSSLTASENSGVQWITLQQWPTFLERSLSSIDFNQDTAACCYFLKHQPQEQVLGRYFSCFPAQPLLAVKSPYQFIISYNASYSERLNLCLRSLQCPVNFWVTHYSHFMVTHFLDFF